MDDDISSPWPVPYRRDPAMQRHERSWTLIAGSHRLSFTRVDHYALSHPMLTVADAAPVRRWSLMGAIAVVLGSIAGMATLGLGLNASRAATGHYLLSVAVPATIPFRIDRSKPAPAHAAATPPKTVASTVPSPVATIVVPVGDEVSSFSPPTSSRLVAMPPAIAAAMATGALQQWTSDDGAERGFVVAGPAEQGCRILSILIRRDGNSDVRTRRECAAGAGDGTTTP